MKYVPIPVVHGDVFVTEYSGAIVVLETNALHAFCVYARSGKRTRIQKQRLQEEYSRACGIDSRRALKSAVVKRAIEARRDAR